jgi:hypothetical protein
VTICDDFWPAISRVSAEAVGFEFASKSSGASWPNACVLCADFYVLKQRTQKYSGRNEHRGTGRL